MSIFVETYRATVAPADCGTEFKCVLLDLDKRQATAIPDDIRAAAAQRIGVQS